MSYKRYTIKHVTANLWSVSKKGELYYYAQSLYEAMRHVDELTDSVRQPDDVMGEDSVEN
jgi:hypothetical protein